MPRPKSPLRQFIEALKQDQLQILGEKCARLKLSQRRNLEPMRMELLENRSQVEPAIPGFLQTLGKDELRTICSRLGLVDSGQKQSLSARIIDFVEPQEAAPRQEVSEPGGQRKKIFIVHGHDKAMLNDITGFLERIDIEPIVLARQPNSGDTIIESLEKYVNAKLCAHAIVLLSPDDVGNKAHSDGEAMNRARQNVIFEFGMVIGALGRKGVILLRKGDVEIFSDIHGVIYIPYGDDSDAVHAKLVRELNNKGLDISGDAALRLR